MSAKSAGEFVDANILVYAFDASAGAKRAKAGQLLERLWDAGTGCMSVQVLQEFFVTVTRKVAQPLSIDEASERLREFASWNTFAPTAQDVLAAVALHKQTELSFWDAMVVYAASELGCEVLWTEDLNDGQLRSEICHCVGNDQAAYSSTTSVEQHDFGWTNILTLRHLLLQVRCAVLDKQLDASGTRASGINKRYHYLWCDCAHV